MPSGAGPLGRPGRREPARRRRRRRTPGEGGEEDETARTHETLATPGPASGQAIAIVRAARRVFRSHRPPSGILVVVRGVWRPAVRVALVGGAITLAIGCGASYVAGGGIIVDAATDGADPVDASDASAERLWHAKFLRGIIQWNSEFFRQ